MNWIQQKSEKSHEHVHLLLSQFLEARDSLARRDIAEGEPRKFALTYSGRWWHLDYRSTPTRFAARRGAASPLPTAVYRTIWTDLLHDTGTAAAAAVEVAGRGWKRERKRRREVQTAGWLAGWLVCRRPKGSHCRLALDAINHFATVYAIHYLRGGPLYLRSLISYTVCTHMQMRIVWIFGKLAIDACVINVYFTFSSLDLFLF